MKTVSSPSTGCQGSAISSRPSILPLVPTGQVWALCPCPLQWREKGRSGLSTSPATGKPRPARVFKVESGFWTGSLSVFSQLLDYLYGSCLPVDSFCWCIVSEHLVHQVKSVTCLYHSPHLHTPLLKLLA